MTTARRNRTANTHAAAIMAQAPLVMWMRLPLLLMEMARPWGGGSRSESERALTEKIGAGMEAAGNLQIELVSLWTETALGMMSGATSGPVAALHTERLQKAALEPYARRVRANASRLKRRSSGKKSGG